MAPRDLTRFCAVPEVRCPVDGCLEIWTYDDWIASGFFVRSPRIEGCPLTPPTHPPQLGEERRTRLSVQYALSVMPEVRFCPLCKAAGWLVRAAEWCRIQQADLYNDGHRAQRAAPTVSAPIRAVTLCFAPAASRCVTHDEYWAHNRPLVHIHTREAKWGHTPL